MKKPCALLSAVFVTTRRELFISGLMHELDSIFFFFLFITIYSKWKWHLSPFMGNVYVLWHRWLIRCHLQLTLNVPSPSYVSSSTSRACFFSLNLDSLTDNDELLTHTLMCTMKITILKAHCLIIHFTWTDMHKIMLLISAITTLKSYFIYQNEYD